MIRIDKPMAAPIDGRQSETALAIRRGTARLLLEHNHAVAYEMTLANGRRADIVALAPDGTMTIIEVKSSVTDFRTDQKWPDYLDFCDSFAFATSPDMPETLFPEEAGLIIADAYGASWRRFSESEKLSAARRKAMLIRFARHTARCLHRLDDPAAFQVF